MALGLVLMSGTCLSPERPASMETLVVIDYLTLNDSLGNEIIGAKICTESPKYNYLYQLDNEMWIASNQQWAIGQRVKLMQTIDTTYAK